MLETYDTSFAGKRFAGLKGGLLAVSQWKQCKRANIDNARVACAAAGTGRGSSSSSRSS